jgi:hypothetical protein
MMPGSPSANAMMSSGMGHHSPSIPTSNPAMMAGSAPDIAGSPISSVSQPTLTGDSSNRMYCISSGMGWIINLISESVIRSLYSSTYFIEFSEYLS